MNVRKHLGVLGTVGLLLALSVIARADNPWSIYWNGGLTGHATQNEDGGWGGVFHTVLSFNNQPVAYDSVCNEVGENISSGQSYTAIEVLSLTSLQGADLNKGTYGGFGNYVTAGTANRGGIAYVMANHFNESRTNDLKATALQAVVWKLWGFSVDLNNQAAYGATDQTTIAGYANAWYNAASAETNFQNPYVKWIRLAQDKNGNIVPFQDQLTILTPEGASLALFLPGIVPLGLALYRRRKK